MGRQGLDWFVFVCFFFELAHQLQLGWILTSLLAVYTERIVPVLVNLVVMQTFITFIHHLAICG